MTKKEQVLALDDGTRTTQEIADLVGCLPSYVRTCRQRRQGPSPADRNYRPKLNVRLRTLYHAIPYEERSRITRENYKANIAKGMPPKKANKSSSHAIEAASRRRFYEVTP